MMTQLANPAPKRSRQLRKRTRAHETRARRLNLAVLWSSEARKRLMPAPVPNYEAG